MTWGGRENKLVKPTHWKVILQETPIFSRHRLPGLVHCHSAKTDSLATTREQIGETNTLEGDPAPARNTHFLQTQVACSSLVCWEGPHVTQKGGIAWCEVAREV